MTYLKNSVEDKNEVASDAILKTVGSWFSVSLECKQQSLQTEAARRLLEFFPDSIREMFVRCYFDSDIGSMNAREVCKYLKTHAVIPKIVGDDSTSSKTFEWLYHKKTAQNPIDHYFTQSESGRQISKRLDALKKQLPVLITQEYQGRRVLIDHVGSGPGYDLIETLEENRDLTDMVHARCIDPDMEALNIGQSVVESMGFSDHFSFVSKKFQKVSSREADIILLIGILCPLPMHVCRKILKGLVHYTRPGGIIVYSTAQYRMMRDPLCDYIMRLFGWQMDHKTDEAAWNLAKTSSWEPLYQFFDQPFRHHCMTVARQPV